MDRWAGNPVSATHFRIRPANSSVCNKPLQKTGNAFPELPSRTRKNNSISVPGSASRNAFVGSCSPPAPQCLKQVRDSGILDALGLRLAAHKFRRGARPALCPRETAPRAPMYH